MGRVHMTLEALGSSVHKAANLAHMLLFKLVNFLVLVVELLQLEGARTKLAGVIEFRSRRGHPDMVVLVKRLAEKLTWRLTSDTSNYNGICQAVGPKTAEKLTAVASCGQKGAKVASYETSVAIEECGGCANIVQDCVSMGWLTG